MYLVGLVGSIVTENTIFYVFTLCGIAGFFALAMVTYVIYKRSEKNLLNAQREMVNFFIDNINNGNLIWSDVDEQKAWDADPIKPLERI